MKRDFELIRKLLFFFEEKEGSAIAEEIELEGYSKEEIGYHARLLNDAGFLRCEEVKSTTSDRIIKVFGFELTWDGHEFLDKIRKDTTWNSIKSYCAEKGLALSFSVVSALATQNISQLLSNA